jgi:hypothetical protein
VLEKGMLRKVLGSSRVEEMGGWRKLHNKELHDLQYSLIIMYVVILKRIKMTWTCVTDGRK